METTLYRPSMPRFRDNVILNFASSEVQISRGSTLCTFEIQSDERQAVSILLNNLILGSKTEIELAEQSPEISDKIPHLLDDLQNLRFLQESDQCKRAFAMSGTQLYREVVRIADRAVNSNSESNFYRALVDNIATREQLIGYALEYWWVVSAAPGVISPALATAHLIAERHKIQDYLRSELGHDKFLSTALNSVGITESQLTQHQPLPATFSMCAALGVYARQHPLSFKACLFLFERSQPEFINAFERRCQELGLSEGFYGPLRVHADINEDFDHGDISRTLMEFNNAVDAESVTVVKRHVLIMVETLIEQEQQILDFYGRHSPSIPRIFP